MPPTYGKASFGSSQHRLAQLVSEALGGIEYLDWNLEMTGETGRTYAQLTQRSQRVQQVQHTLEKATPSTNITNRNVIVVDDIWVTGTAAQTVGRYVRAQGASSVSYFGYASLNESDSSNEYLLNCHLLLRRQWNRLEKILTQGSKPTRHLFNIFLEDECNWQVFSSDCPAHIQKMLFSLAEEYYSDQLVPPSLKYYRFFERLG